MRRRELIVYREFPEGGDELLARVEDLAGNDQNECCGCVYELIAQAEKYGFHGNLWHCCLAHLLATNENAYSRGCEMRGRPSGSIYEAALHDMAIFREFFAYDFAPSAFRFMGRYESCATGAYDAQIGESICTLAQSLGGAGSPEEMIAILTEFYQKYGVGKFGLHKAFRIVGGAGRQVRIEPIPHIAPVRLADLVGYALQKRKLVENTEAFVAGRRANNCLLFGDAGTGKSTCVRAIANEYYDQGLRVIEVYKHQLRELQETIAQVRGRNYKFILFLDDLSFEDFETEYKYLKAVIEGGLEKQPGNVLLYATSNRRHLIRENYGDKTEDGHIPEIRQDMHTSDTVQEKLSLAYRFGVTIYFGSPDRRQFQAIVRTLAERHGVVMPEEELLLEANQWELSHGGLSGRTAQQFIDHLLGKMPVGTGIGGIG